MPGAAERVRIWRRLRRRRRVREALLLDLGALVYELHRQGRRAPELLQEKAGELSEIDDEVRGLEQMLEDDGHGPEPMPGDETDEWAAPDTGEWPSGEEDAYDEPYEGEDEDLYEDEEDEEDDEGDVYEDDYEGEPAAPDDEEPRP